MNARLFLAISAIVAIAYGLGFLFVPEPLANLYGASVNPSMIMEARFFGSALLTIGIIAWLLRGSSDITALRGVLYGFAIGNIAGIWVSATGTLAGTMNFVGWSAVAIYSLLFLGAIAAVSGLSRQPTAA